MAAERPVHIRVKAVVDACSSSFWIKVQPSDVVAVLMREVQARHTRRCTTCAPDTRTITGVSWEGSEMGMADLLCDFLADKDVVTCSVSKTSAPPAAEAPHRAPAATTAPAPGGSAGVAAAGAGAGAAAAGSFVLRYRLVAPINAPIRTLERLSRDSTLVDVSRAIAIAESSTMRFMLYSPLGFPFCDTETPQTQPLHSWGITSGDVVFAVPYKLEWRGLANYDAVADAPLDARSLGSVNLFVKNHQGSTRTLCVDLTKHTVHDVKRMMFSLEGIQPSMQRLYFGGRPLKPASLLMDAGVNRDSTLEMQGVPAAAVTTGWEANFAKGSLQASVAQSDNSLAMFWSALYTICTDMASDDRENGKPSDRANHVLGHILALTRFPPVVHALAKLFRHESIRFAERLAVLEGLYQLFAAMIDVPAADRPTDVSSDADSALLNVLDCWAYVIAEARSDVHNVSLQTISLDCEMSATRARDPVLVPGVNGVFSRNAVLSHVWGGKGAIPGCSVHPLTEADLRPAHVHALLARSAGATAGDFTFWTPEHLRDGLSTSAGAAASVGTPGGDASTGTGAASGPGASASAAADSGEPGGTNDMASFSRWTNAVATTLVAAEPQPPPRMPSKAAWQRLRDRVQTDRTLDVLRVRKPTELRRFTAPRLTRQTNTIAVHAGRGKGATNVATLFSPVSGASTDHSPDEMAADAAAAALDSGSAHEGGGDATAMPLLGDWGITPTEATVVLLDISSSMDMQAHAGDDTLTRLDAVKSLFNSFVDRSLAYQLPHVVGLVLFGTRARIECPITEAFELFMTHVRDAVAKGTTALFDAIVLGADMLLTVRRVYPSCTLRILALTDGEDVSSTASCVTAVEKVQSNSIVVDSVIINPDERSLLKGISVATGGACFRPTGQAEATRVFELETMLSVRDRAVTQRTAPRGPITTTAALEAAATSVADSTTDSLPRVVPARLANPATSGAAMLRSELRRQRIAPASAAAAGANAGRRRQVMRELVRCTRDPHPCIQVFPIESDMFLWRLLVTGPSGTPYDGGVFMGYLEFGPDYPATAPELRFQTPLVHCNVNSQGKVCHSIFDRNWTRDTSITLVLSCVYGLLLAPEPEDPLDTGLATLYLTERAKYDRQARASTQAHASKSVDAWLAEFGVDSTEADTIPPALRCPLTHRLLEDPVMVRGGVYSRAAITAYIRRHGTHPSDHAPVTEAEIFASQAVARLVEEHRRDVEALAALAKD